MPRPSLLILSFSPIQNDARVLKQVRYFATRYDVTTCGYGPQPIDGVRHVEIPREARTNDLDGRLITLRAYRAVYDRQASVRAARKLLAGTTFDVILADDIDTLKLAVDLRPRRGVHSDLHEYWPRLQDDNPVWLRRVGRYYSWVCRTYLPRCRSVTTVSPRFAEEYTKNFGVPCEVVVNATPYHPELEPTPVGDRLRLVHSGTSHRVRNLPALLDAVENNEAVTLDLYLTPNDPAHLDEIKARAAHLDNVTVHDPVPYDDLIATLNRHDIGVHLLLPASFSWRWTIPNKIYDFAQARLGAIIGPNPPDMIRLVEDHGFGVVTDGYDGESLRRAIDGLTPERVVEFKSAAHRAARELSAETEVPKWGAAIAAILAD